MKLKTKIIYTLLAIVSALNIAACGKGDSMENETDLKTVINDFSEYKSSFMPLRLGGFFGSVEINEDKNFVLTGDKSAKLTVFGDPDRASTARTHIYQPLNAPGIFDFSDFSAADKLEINIYNDSDCDVPMSASVSYAGNEAAAFDFVLKPKEWNKAIFSASIERYGIGNDIRDASAIKLYFDTPEKDAEVPVLYLDSIVLHKFENPPEIAATVFSDEDEICYFDRLYQEYVPIAKQFLPGFDPVLSLNMDPRFTKSGYSLKCDYNGNDGSITTWTYAGFAIPSAYIQKTNMSTMAADDYFAFDVYNDSLDTQRIMLEFRQHTTGTKYFSDTVVYLSPKKWTKVSYKASDMNATSALTEGTKKAGEIYIHWDIYLTPKGERTMYFDSFRIERAE